MQYKENERIWMEFCDSKLYNTYDFAKLFES